MAVSKVILNGNTLMDTTDKTVEAGSMLSGITALKNDGTTATGNIASKSSSDLTASTLTVTAPAGYYASNATKTLTDANLVAGNIKKDVSIFGVTGSYEGSGGGGGGDYPWFGPNTVKDYTKTITINLKDDTSWDSWTASTTAGSILAAPTTADFSYTFNYKDYIATIVSTAITSYTFKSTATKKNIPFANGRVDIFWQFGYPSTYDNYMNYAIGTYSNISQVIKQTIYYYSGTGVKSASASSSNGVYTYSAPSISTTTSGNNITLTYKRSPIYAKCNTTYFAVERKDDIDSENTNLIITVDVYKTPINNDFIWKLIEEMVTGMNSAPENQ